jgi:hypothetical protein
MSFVVSLPYPFTFWTDNQALSILDYPEYEFINRNVKLFSAFFACVPHDYDPTTATGADATGRLPALIDRYL